MRFCHSKMCLAKFRIVAFYLIVILLNMLQSEIFNGFFWPLFVFLSMRLLVFYSLDDEPHTEFNHLRLALESVSKETSEHVSHSTKPGQPVRFPARDV